jgi:putative toxin-antitoxin system antitoxin component (TIGR02293 family)
VRYRPGAVAVFFKEANLLKQGENFMNAAPLAEVLEELKELRRHGGADNEVLSKAEQRLRAFSLEMVSAVGGSEREALVRMLDISTLAARVFGDAERAEAWLTRPNTSLSRQRPLDLVRDELGTAVVREMLEQIDHGIFA